MKVRPILLLALPFFGASADPEFVGVLTTQNEARYAVRPAPEATSRWLRAGQTIGGYSIHEYFPKEEVLVLRRGVDVLRLKLKTAKVANSVAPVGVVKQAVAVYTLTAERDKLVRAVPPPTGP